MAFSVIIELNSGSTVVIADDHPEKVDADRHATQVRVNVEGAPSDFARFDSVDGDRIQVRIASIAAIISRPTDKPRAGRVW